MTWQPTPKLCAYSSSKNWINFRAMKTSMVKDITKGRKSWRVGLNPKYLSCLESKLNKRFLVVSHHPEFACSTLQPQTQDKKFSTEEAYEAHPLLGLMSRRCRWIQQPGQPRALSSDRKGWQSRASQSQQHTQSWEQPQQGQPPWHLMVAWAFNLSIWQLSQVKAGCCLHHLSCYLWIF